MKKLAHLILENGTIFQGISVGIEGETIGEIVFNTAMTGYQEILTDPSYLGQIISFTSPHIGNVGTNQLDEESKKIHANGIITRSISSLDSNFRSTQNLSKYIQKHRIIAISNIDTRKLTHILRNIGSLYGCIQSEKYMNIKNAIHKINSYKNKKNITISTGVKKIKKWNIEKYKNTCNKKKFHVVVYDFGVKNSILRILQKKGCKITLIPSNTSVENILSLQPSGILLSNGPGDPRSYLTSIKNIKKILKFSIPVFGICLGHQILALSLGAKIIKMKFGHHGSNHPVQNIYTKRVFITTQNHNFTIDKKSIKKNIIVTHISLFDKTIQGITLKNHPYFSFQGHPESNPGTHDIQQLFDTFINNMYKKEILNAQKK
ncbi:glutamine-hydrolyzing carbamoyl-phosphate synthase small subunit [Buchnera aphidicola]|uniref:Carbamoyl phosphate synthase small chain n=1 Tax=Buchnera aphidicola (Cinara laricifoliae) TaxID=2518977 RepID=A0A451DBA5_9GAMM|nr:glutamine-hydrolyzing carbamoyl-phosphate synthase small subunit [Buchnera aphidicola]VFP83571.1 Carbamoyl-phosphate synthase small chain [Buchnera aphidicola (Cinara laricifoliae)]